MSSQMERATERALQTGGMVICCQWDDFAKGTGGSYYYTDSDIAHCEGDKTCESEVFAQLKAEAIAETQAFWAQYGVEGDAAINDMMDVRRMTIEHPEAFNEGAL